jgi:hypothetical protein
MLSFSKIYRSGQGGEIGRRAGLRIAKSSNSKRRFSFQNKAVFTRENASPKGIALLLRTVSRNAVVLAQILAQGRTKLQRLLGDRIRREIQLRDVRFAHTQLVSAVEENARRKISAAVIRFREINFRQGDDCTSYSGKNL